MPSKAPGSAKIKKHIHALHVAILAAVIASFGVSFDGWWHLTKGRDSFFVLPHLFIHAGVLIMLAQSFFAWRRLRMPSWRRIFFVLLVIPLTIPLDELWHQWQGKELVSSVLIVWSPPHFLFFAAAISALILLVRELQTERDLAGREIFGALLLASLLNVLLVFLAPFAPFSPYMIAGFWGAGVAIFLSVSTYFIAERILAPIIPALLVAFFTLAFQGVLVDAGASYGSRAVGTYPYLPGWVLLLSQISMAAIVASRMFKSRTLLGLCAGLSGAGLLYLTPLITPVTPVHYTLVHALIALTSAGVAGAVAPMATQMTIQWMQRR